MDKLAGDQEFCILRSSRERLPSSWRDAPDRRMPPDVRELGGFAETPEQCGDNLPRLFPIFNVIESISVAWWNRRKLARRLVLGGRVLATGAPEGIRSYTVTGQSFFDPTATFQNSNVGGNTSVLFTTHIDYGNLYNNEPSNSGSVSFE